MTQQLTNASTYIFGDFIIRPIDANHISIKTDKGCIVVEPKAGNHIIAKSTK